MVKNLPGNAGDVISIPGQGNMIPHAMEQLNPCAATTEAKELWSPCTAIREPACHNSWACSGQWPWPTARDPCAVRKFLCAVNKTWYCQLNQYILKKRIISNNHLNIWWQLTVFNLQLTWRLKNNNLLTFVNILSFYIGLTLNKQK